MPTMFDEMNLDALYAMFKGEWGTRKSTSALSFPTPQYWFSWDQKMRALLIPMKNWGLNPKDIHSDDYGDWDAPRKKLESLQVNCPYKTIVVDTITSLGDSALRQVKSMKRGQTGKDNKQKGMTIGGIEVNEIDDYKAEESALSEMIALTKDIHKYHKVNIILIAHVIRTEYRTLGSSTINVSRSIVTAGKKISAKIPAYCDEIYHFNIETSAYEGKEGDYAVITSHTGEDYARTGLPLANKIIFNDQPLYTKHLLPAINKLKEGTK